MPGSDFLLNGVKRSANGNAIKIKIISGLKFKNHLF